MAALPRDLISQLFGDEPPIYESLTRPGSVQLRADVSGDERHHKPDNEAWRTMFTIKVVGNVERKFFPIGALASAVGTTTYSVRRWTQMGRLPQAPYRLQKSIGFNGEEHQGRRLYTEPMIVAAQQAFDDRNLLEGRRVEWKDHAELTLEIHDAWSAIYELERSEHAAASSTPRRLA